VTAFVLVCCVGYVVVKLLRAVSAVHAAKREASRAANRASTND
jgi:hypothetical protein